MIGCSKKEEHIKCENVFERMKKETKLFKNLSLYGF